MGAFARHGLLEGLKGAFPVQPPAAFRQCSRSLSLAVVLGYSLLLSSAVGAQNPIVSRLEVPGALAGKTVFLSAGHGFYHHGSLGWITQRGNSNGLVEDFLNAELAHHWLVPYLENAGADVWTCRDRCFSDVEVIVDDADSDYRESGDWQSVTGLGWGGAARRARVTAVESATATFRPEIPESGRYPLYVWFPGTGSRSASVLIRVTHGGGETERRITQRRDGNTWRYVGSYWWHAGDSQTVTISNDGLAADVGREVLADAIRIGGGRGSEGPNAGGPRSGRRRADEAAVYFTRYQGAPASVWNALSGDNDNDDDVTCRPRYAEWEREVGEDAVFLSVHSNAGGGTGTSTFAYLDGTPSGSFRLRDLIQEEVVRDLRALVDPDWRDRGTQTANFGELRLLETMPGALVEVAFHDNPSDAALEKQPRFRKIVARALYQAVARYFNGDDVVLSPEPPRDPRVRIESSIARLTWSAPVTGAAAAGASPPTSYRVYRSSDGLSFDGGVEVAGRQFVLDGLVPGAPVFLRVTAVNEGGESFPSPVVVTRLPSRDRQSAPRILLVDGADRMDAGLNLRVAESAALGVVDRQPTGRALNSYDYVVEHLAMLDSDRLDIAIESATAPALAGEADELTPFDAVVWFTGRDDAASGTLDASDRALLRPYIESGGAVLVSGQEIASDLDAGGSATERAFYRDVLRARRDHADHASRRLAPAAAAFEAFVDLEPFALGGPYPLLRPDALLPLSGGQPSLVFSPSGDTAAVSYAGGYRLLSCSFPVESIELRGARSTIGERALEFLLERPPSPPRVVIESSAGNGVVRLIRGQGEVLLDASASDDGDGGGASELAFRWEKIAGPAGEWTAAAPGRELVRSGIGYGDGDDRTRLDDMQGGYASISLRRAFTISRIPERLLLHVILDDGCRVRLNGVEVARHNLAAGAAFDDFAREAVEPEEILFDLSEHVETLRMGERNVLAVDVHNASLASSDLSFDVELVAQHATRRERLIPWGARWFLHRGLRAAPAGWSTPEFEATTARATFVFLQPGLFRYRLTVDDGELQASTEIDVRVAEAASTFRRGDVNDDRNVDVSDAIATLEYLFSDSAPIICLDAADADDSGEVDLTDAIRTLTWLFLEGLAPAAPGPRICGIDPTEDEFQECPVGTCE